PPPSCWLPAEAAGEPLNPGKVTCHRGQVLRLVQRWTAWHPERFGRAPRQPRTSDPAWRSGTHRGPPPSPRCQGLPPYGPDDAAKAAPDRGGTSDTCKDREADRSTEPAPESTLRIPW